MINQIEEAYRENRDSWNEDHRIRVHRAISWLKSADKYQDDPDICFMSAVNAANACWGRPMTHDKDAITMLCKNLEGSGALKKIHSAFRSAEGQRWLMILISNKHLYWQYWRFLQGEIDEHEFNVKASGFKRYAIKAINEQRYDYLLKSVLHQALAIRGQVFHGFTTYESSANREVLELSALMFRKLISVIVSEMIASPDKDWGTVPWTFGTDKQEHNIKKVAKYINRNIKNST